MLDAGIQFCFLTGLMSMSCSSIDVINIGTEFLSYTTVDVIGDLHISGEAVKTTGDDVSVCLM